MSARKRRRKTRKKSIKFKIYLILAIVVVVLVLIFNKGLWNSRSKLSIVIQDDNQILVSTLDPVNNTITNIIIPGSTEVSSARGLGTWRVGSLWELGVNEGLEGKLLTETITRYFKMPSYAWAEKPAKGFSSNSLFRIAAAAITPYKTNLSISDRIKIALFSARVKNPQIDIIDLSATSSLEQVDLIDGGSGYVVVRALPARLLLIFSDESITLNKSRVKIIGATKKDSISDDLGEVLQVLGAKVTSIVREESRNLDCIVGGKRAKEVEKIISILGCVEKKNFTSDNFDLEILFGEEFIKRY